MACQGCLDKCCVRPCVEALICALDCCGCCHIPVLLGPNLNLEAGTLLGQKTSDARFYPYNPLATDGTQQFRGFLKHHVQTDADGRIVHRYFSFLGASLDCGPLYDNLYICGIFRIQDLRGDVASAIASGVLKTLDAVAPYTSGLVRL